MKKLHEAIKVAIKGRGDKKYHLGCIAQRADGSIVSSFNCRAQGRAPSLHAEVKVLKKAGMGAILYIGRVLADGSWASAKPCEGCMKTIRKYKVKTVYYTIESDTYGVWKVN